MPDPITEARHALEEERDALRARLTDIDTAYAALAGLSPQPSTRAGRRQRAQADGVRQANGRLPRGALTAAIPDLLAGAGTLHGDEILAKLDAQGLSPAGANPKASLANALQRLAKQGKIRRAGRNRWRAGRR